MISYLVGMVSAAFLGRYSRKKKRKKRIKNGTEKRKDQRREIGLKALTFCLHLLWPSI